MAPKRRGKESGPEHDGQATITVDDGGVLHPIHPFFLRPGTPYRAAGAVSLVAAPNAPACDIAHMGLEIAAVGEEAIVKFAFQALRLGIENRANRPADYGLSTTIVPVESVIVWPAIEASGGEFG